MQLRGTCDTGGDAGSHETALKKADPLQPGLYRVPPGWTRETRQRMRRHAGEGAQTERRWHRPGAASPCANNL